jgi:dephospho-CoA kinase
MRRQFSRRRTPDRPRGPWKHGSIPVLGLVGPIGAGKSRVAAELAAGGAQVLDADAVGHALLEQRPARDLVLERFGPAILDRSAPAGADEGTGPAPPRIDRRALGALVFNDAAALRALEAILHPRMRRTFERAIARAQRGGRARAVVLDAAILLEAGWNDLCDLVVFVDAPRDQRLARVAEQRGWTAEQLEARERAQWPAERKRERADVVLVNDSDPERLRAEIDARVWGRIAQGPPASETSPRPPREPARTSRRRSPSPTGSRHRRPGPRAR